MSVEEVLKSIDTHWGKWRSKVYPILDEVEGLTTDEEYADWMKKNPEKAKLIMKAGVELAHLIKASDLGSLSETPDKEESE